MKRTFLIIALALTSLAGLRCSDSFEPATSLGEDILGIVPENQFAPYRGKLPVGEEKSVLDRSADSGLISGLHRLESWLAVGEFDGKYGSTIDGASEHCTAYVEFDAEELASLLNQNATHTLDSMVVIFPRLVGDSSLSRPCTDSSECEKDDSTAVCEEEDTSACTPESTSYCCTQIDIGFPEQSKDKSSPHITPGSIPITRDAVGDKHTIRATVVFDEEDTIRGILQNRLLKPVKEDDLDMSFAEARMFNIVFPTLRRPTTTTYLPTLVTSADSVLLLGAAQGSNPPRIKVYYHEKINDTLAADSLTLRAFHSEFTVHEAAGSIDELADRAYSSAASGRYAIIPLDLTPLWEAMDDTSRDLRFRSILAASIEVGVAEARWKSDSLVFTYVLDGAPDLALEDLYARHSIATTYSPRTSGRSDNELIQMAERLSESFPINVAPGMTVRLDVADMLADLLIREGGAPDSAYLYLVLPPAHVLAVKMHNPPVNDFGSIRWDVGATMKVEATFSKPLQG
jgi:hypothetical protein